jgi:hypothetical protein
MKQFKTKLQKVSQNVTPFAEISFVNNAFNQIGLSELIDTELGGDVGKERLQYRVIYTVFFF